jgi:hypothetical protein
MTATQQEVRPMSRAIDPMLFDGDALNLFHREAPGSYSTREDLAIMLPATLWDASLPRPPDSPSALQIGDGVLGILSGYEFDGASGPAIDGVGNILAALIHDALYEAIAQGATGLTYAAADAIYRRICIAQGSGRPRAWLHYATLRSFGWLWRLTRR